MATCSMGQGKRHSTFGNLIKNKLSEGWWIEQICLTKWHSCHLGKPTCGLRTDHECCQSYCSWLFGPTRQCFMLVLEELGRMVWLRFWVLRFLFARWSRLFLIKAILVIINGSYLKKQSWGKGWMIGILWIMVLHYCPPCLYRENYVLHLYLSFNCVQPWHFSRVWFFLFLVYQQWSQIYLQ